MSNDTLTASILPEKANPEFGPMIDTTHSIIIILQKNNPNLDSLLGLIEFMKKAFKKG